MYRQNSFLEPLSNKSRFAINSNQRIIPERLLIVMLQGEYIVGMINLSPDLQYLIDECIGSLERALSICLVQVA